MKKLLVALSFALCVAGAAQAQKKGGTPEERAAKKIEAMSDLKLSAEQKTKLTALFVAQAKSTDSLTAAGVSKEEMKEKMKPVMQNARKAQGAILTEEQKKMLAEKMKARQGGGDNN